MTWFLAGAVLGPVSAAYALANAGPHAIVQVDDPRDVQYLPRHTAKRNCRNCGAPAEAHHCSYCLTPSEDHHAG